VVSHTNSRKQPGIRNERGQVVVLVVVMLVVLLGFAALVIDVGYAYYAHRQLQASADAAALAGAQELPNQARAIAVARDYSSSEGAKNEHHDIPDVQTTVETKCINSIPGCDPVNAVVVLERAPTKTFFAGLFGIDSFTIKAKATACSPCGIKPLDIMMVLDRTGSMCQDSQGRSDPDCTDLNNAKDGMRTFLQFLEPSIQWVGLAVLPPASGTNQSARCATPNESNYNNRNSPYVIVGVRDGDDYSNDRVLDPSSKLVSTINCQKGNGRTAYANALEAAQAELEVNGRPDVKNVIIFLSDGAANTGPTYYSSNSDYRRRPCRQGVNSAATIKSRGTLIYSIGYDLNALNGGANICTSSTGSTESPSITAYDAIRQIASSPNAFFNKPDAGQLRTIFTEIAADLARGTSALIDESVE
jgi:Putative Flp pilus-assembly TadE/G-like/von Willebrand factor type A domain